MRDNWTETTLGALVNIQKGKKPLLLGDNTTTGQPYLTADVLRGSAPSQFVLQSALATCVQLQGNETILLWDGAGAGDVFRSTTGVLASTMAKLAIKPTSLISEDYLYLVVMNASPEIKSSCRGTTVPHVSPGALSAISLTLPPLSEQQRIVDVIGAVDAYIAALRQQADDARAARNAVLHELLTDGGDDWTETTLGALVNIQKGKKPLLLGDNTTTGQPYLTADVLRGSAPSQFVLQSALATCVQLQGNETILLWDGAGAGDVFRSTTGVLASTMAKLAIKPTSLISEDYLYLVVMNASPEIKSSCRGTTVPHVSPGALSAISLTLPPLSEQKRIVGIFSAMDGVVTATEKAVSDAHELRSGLLSNLLSGDHEIPESYDRLLGAA